MIQTTVIVRDRGQLTIPDEIREILNWITPQSVVSIKVTTQNELVIEPYKSEIREAVDWKKIWENIQLARSFKGKRGNLSKFILQDREKH